MRLRSLRKMLWKRSKVGRALRALKWFTVIPVGVILAGMICFFAMDDFNLLFLASVENKRDNTSRPSVSDDGIPLDWVSEGYGENFTGDFSNVEGGIGLSGMMINEAREGFYKEYLQIVRSMSNWETMHPEVKPIKRDGKAVYPNVTFLLGLQLSESGAETIANSEFNLRISPKATMRRAAWKQDGKHTLYKYNSEVVKEDGLGTMDSGYTRLDMLYGDDWTHIQYQNRNHAALYPNGRQTAQATYWPSTLNGYGIPDSRRRSKADTDAAYFPDLMGIALQHSWCVLDDYPRTVDLKTLTPSAMQSVVYPMYNYGPSGWQRGYGVGTKSGSEVYTLNGWNSKNTISYAANAAYSMNWLDSKVNEFLARFTSDYDGYAGDIWKKQLAGSNPYGPINHSDYKGIAVMTVLMNGGFTSVKNAATIKSEMADGGFARGAIIAYRVWSGDKSANRDTVINWINTKMTVKNPDTSVYPEYNDAIAYYIDNDAPKIYRDDGTGPIAPLRAYDQYFRGVFFVRVGGVMAYWRMLLASGVEITLEDAYTDSVSGKKIPGPGIKNYYDGSLPFKYFYKDSATTPKLTSAMYWRDGTGGSTPGIHYGEDYTSFREIGRPYYAIASGYVRLVTGLTGGYGYTVLIEVDRPLDKNGEPYGPKMVYRYAHMSKRAVVSEGDHVREGQLIGYSGNTGGNYDPHMHLELRLYRNKASPSTYYLVPMKAVFDRKFTCENVPCVIFGNKQDVGYVYGPDTSKPLGTLKSVQQKDLALRATGKEQNDMYYDFGLMRFGEESKKQKLTEW